jgi:hypothetical protein
MASFYPTLPSAHAMANKAMMANKEEPSAPYYYSLNQEVVADNAIAQLLRALKALPDLSVLKNNRHAAELRDILTYATALPEQEDSGVSDTFNFIQKPVFKPAQTVHFTQKPVLKPSAQTVQVVPQSHPIDDARKIIMLPELPGQTAMPHNRYEGKWQCFAMNASAKTRCCHPIVQDNKHQDLLVFLPEEMPRYCGTHRKVHANIVAQKEDGYTRNKAMR